MIAAVGEKRLNGLVLIIILNVVFIVTLAMRTMQDPWIGFSAGWIIVIGYLKYHGFSWYSSINLSVIYLLVFDSPQFNLTTFNIRIWYIIIFIGLLWQFIQCFLLNRGVRRNWVLGTSFFLMLSFISFINDDSMGRFYNIKYWLFSFGLLVWFVLIVRELFSRFPYNVSQFIIGIFGFVAIFGIWQSVSLSIGLGGFYMLYPSNVRPDAFFSETTWYATYCLAGLIYVLWVSRTFALSHLIIFAPIFLIGMLLSNTRNAFLGLILIVAIIGVKFLIGIRPRQSTKTIKACAFVLVLMLIGISLNASRLAQLVELVGVKLNLQDDSAQGRFEGFSRSFEMIAESPIWGHGFNWDENNDVIMPAGTAIGAKSFNLYLQILHIFGLVGFLPFITFVIVYGIKLIRRQANRFDYSSHYALYFYCIFFVLSFFAPVHQFPMGIYILSIAFFLMKQGEGSITIKAKI